MSGRGRAIKLGFPLRRAPDAAPSSSRGSWWAAHAAPDAPREAFTRSLAARTAEREHAENLHAAHSIHIQHEQVRQKLLGPPPLKLAKGRRAS